MGSAMTVPPRSAEQHPAVPQPPLSVAEQVAGRRRARRKPRRGGGRLLKAFREQVHAVRAFVWQSGRRFRELIVQRRTELLTSLFSLLLHLCLAFLLACWILPQHVPDRILNLFLDPDRDAAEAILAVEITPDIPADSEPLLTDDMTVLEELDADLQSASTSDDDLSADLMPVSAAEDMGLLANLGDLGARSAAGRQAALRAYGGTAESEQAVAAGLKWLASIQQEDGSWDFQDPGEGAEPGRLSDGQMGATAMALLCFLGAGHTHEESGPWRKTVDAGLDYLIEHARIDRRRADLHGDSSDHAGMYIQGIATICLCEAHALAPSDSRVRRLAQRALAAIENAQHRGGGWRYRPRSPGDTSVTGWQIMALQSGRMGELRVSDGVLRKAGQFLDSVQDDGGAGYGYVPGDEQTPTMSSVGLLCRIYLGWRQDHSALHRGVAALSARGPHPHSIYYNYYATQVLHHWGGEPWERWNSVMRDQLVRTQISRGPAAGSWSPRGTYSRPGGQIYQTTLSLLTLEVYYRHLPMYRRLGD